MKDQDSGFTYKFIHAATESELLTRLRYENERRWEAVGLIASPNGGLRALLRQANEDPAWDGDRD